MVDDGSFKFEGGCHCRAVRYEAVGPIHHRTHCHCTICRAFGGTLMSWITVDRSRFCVTNGKLKSYHSSTSGRRDFCENCGAHLTFRHSRECDTIDIAIGTLDEPEQFEPDNQIWGSDRLNFLSEMNSLPLAMDGDIETSEGEIRVTETDHATYPSSLGTTKALRRAEVQIRNTKDIPREAIIRLYRANGWSAAEKPQQLYRGLLNSSTLVTAWIEKRLVGLANAITDGHLVVYYPHLLVDPDYQGNGIGQLIMQALQDRYAHMHQQVLIAYDSAVGFYRRCGFNHVRNGIPMRTGDGDDA